MQSARIGDAGMRRMVSTGVCGGLLCVRDGKYLTTAGKTKSGANGTAMGGPLAFDAFVPGTPWVG